MCRGDGQIKIEMHFLPDVYVPCEQCHGKRYNRETLEVRFKGKTIADVLEMPIEEALEFFAHIPKIRRRVEALADVGLGYMRLGQPATTLSGGEAQRVKLAAELSKVATGRTMYILDEPTTGLHFADIQRLLEVLDRLVEAGNSVVVIEHNLDVIKVSDRLIDLGPEGGDEGGQVIAVGTPEEVAAEPGSYTGRFLAGLLEVKARRGRKPAARAESGRPRTAKAPAAGSKNGATSAELQERQTAANGSGNGSGTRRRASCEQALSCMPPDPAPRVPSWAELKLWLQKWRWYEGNTLPWNRARIHWEMLRRGAFARWPVHGNVLEAMREGRLEIGANTLLEPGVWITAPAPARIRIGSGTFLNLGVMVAALDLVEIGDHCMFANGCFITDADHRFGDLDRPITWQGFRSKGPTRVGDNVWCGANVVITSGVTVGERCVIGANSVVTHDIPPYSIAVGRPPA